MRIILLLACLALTLHAAETPTLKVGFDLPMVGNLAYMGEDVRDGANLALEEIQPTQINYQYIFEDSQLTPRIIHEAAVKLISFDKVDCIFSLWANSATVVAPLAEKAGVVHLNTGWDHSFVEKNKWTIVHGGSFQKYAQQTIDYMVSRNVKRVAIVAQRTAGEMPIVEHSLPEFKKAGIEVVSNEFTNVGERDFRVYIGRIKETKPDILWVLYTSPEAEIFFRQKRELGLAAPATAYVTSLSSIYPETQGMEYYSDTWLRPGFLERFKAKYGHAPLIRAGHAYDLMKIYITSAEELYKKLGRVPTHPELLAKIKEPRDLPQLVVGSGSMTASGSIQTGYRLVKIQGDKVVDVNP